MRIQWRLPRSMHRHTMSYFIYILLSALLRLFVVCTFCIISLDCSVCSICWLTLTINLLFCNTYASTRQRIDVISALLFRTCFFFFCSAPLLLALATGYPHSMRFVCGFSSIRFERFSQLFVLTAVEKHQPQNEWFYRSIQNITIQPWNRSK